MTTKTLVGYCDPLSVAPGESIEFKVSCYAPGSFQADIVRLICGDSSPQGAGFQEEEIAACGEYPGREQTVVPGSYARIPVAPALAELTSFSIEAVVWPTLPGGGEQSIVATYSEDDQLGFALQLDSEGALELVLGNGRATTQLGTGVALRRRAWCRVAARFDARTGETTLSQKPLAESPATDTVVVGALVEEQLDSGAYRPSEVDLLIAARHAGNDTISHHFNGKIDAPELQGVDGVVGSWDFSLEIDSQRVRDRGPHRLDGVLWNLPTRAVTGHNWTGEAQSWSARPEHYGAIHFHHDDVYDAGWKTDFSFAVPDGLQSGVYAARLRLGDADDYVPFYVRPPRGRATAEIAFLAPTASYMAYANQRLHLVGVLGNTPDPTPNDEFMLAHLEFGGSLYEHHGDGSGVHYSSRLRPVLNLKAKSFLWGFNADSNITAWLEHTGERYDVITDEDLHAEGAALLSRYRVVITGTHPEYYSTAMLDGLDAYLRQGGRLMYMGGNGFYWRIAFHPDLPGVIEVRRAEDGTRAWISAPGEYYQSFNGEYGGLWRRLGRPPNLLVGIGFAAQGFDGSSHYRRAEGSRDPRAAFIFEGVESEILGDYGRVGGGAAGEELDRYDPSLGSPPHALVLATSEDHKPGMLRVKEEFFATAPPFKDPNVRSDLVFFEGPAGGAVFSTGSIAWAGSLAHQNYDNDIARITTNVLRRFSSK